MASSNDGDKSSFEVYKEKFRHNLGGELAHCLELSDNHLTGLVHNLNENLHLTSARLFQVSYGSWRASTLLALGGTASQVPALLRLAIEQALYSFLFSVDKSYEKKWLNRENDASAKRFLRHGRTGPLAKAKTELSRKNCSLAKRVSGTLDMLIDLGAHPNIFQLVNATEEYEGEVVKTGLILSDELRQEAFVQCCVSAMQISDLFVEIWPLRFDIEAQRQREEIQGQFKLFRNFVFRSSGWKD